MKNVKRKKSKTSSKAKTPKSKTKLSAKKVKNKTRQLLAKTKNKLNNLKKNSSKHLHATEEEILHYVKKNPIKTASAMALTSLIAGFISWRYSKK